MPTEQAQQARRSDAERNDAAYYHSKILQTALGMFIHDVGTTPLEKACARSLKLRLNDKVTEFGGSTWHGDIFANADADRDRQFVEAVREAFNHADDLVGCIERAHVSRYGAHIYHGDARYGVPATPCTAKEKG